MKLGWGLCGIWNKVFPAIRCSLTISLGNDCLENHLVYEKPKAYIILKMDFLLKERVLRHLFQKGNTDHLEA